MGLSTHVLDTHAGGAAVGVVIWLERIADGKRDAISRFATNADGRVPSLLAADALVPGIYELHFHMGDYFRGRGIDLPEPPFIDVVTLRFGVADPAAHYHVPLLCSPWSYTTYRGS